MRDFTPQVLERLFTTLKKHNYKFCVFSEYFSGDKWQKFVVIRHDIDRVCDQAVKVAKIENNLGIKATYYFRCTKRGFPKDIIDKISSLGHEVGYHYEVLAKTNGDFIKAVAVFTEELALLRKYAQVKTISSHGSPFSRWDSRKIWENENFKKFGLIGDCNLSISKGQIFYLTDTGRKWNNAAVNLRDKIDLEHNLSFKCTYDIIEAIKNNKLPSKLVINVHPQRWSERFIPWLNELIWQNVKNACKQILVGINK